MGKSVYVKYRGKLMLGPTNQLMFARPFFLRVTLALFLVIGAVLLEIHTAQSNGASAATTGAVELVPPTVSNVSYGTDPKQVIDVYAAPVGQIRPAVIVVHGGGWTGGDKTSELVIQSASELSKKGFAVFNVNYRLATDALPGHLMQPDDIRSIVGWVQQNGAGYGADTANINMIGGSAGAHLVSLVGQQMNSEQPGTIRSIISLSGPLDLLTAMHPTNSPPVSDSERESVNRYMGCLPSTCTDQQYIDQSPYYNIYPNTCPVFLLINSSDDFRVPQAQSMTMYDKLIENGCEATLNNPSGIKHGFQLYKPFETQIVALLNRGDPASPVEISQLTPAAVDQGTSNVEVVKGTNFQPGATFAAAGTGITVAPDALILSESWAIIHVTVDPTAAPGPRDVTVTNPDGSAGGCIACFTVVRAPTISSVVPAELGHGLPPALPRRPVSPGAGAALSGEIPAPGRQGLPSSSSAAATNAAA